VFDRLGDADRRALRAAAADTVRFAAANNPTDHDAALSVCSDGRRILLATTKDRAALARATAPVYRWLERDAQTRTFIARIRSLARTTPPDPPLDLPAACSVPFDARRAFGPRRPASLLDGTYRWVITRAEAEAAGVGPKPGDVFPMISTAVLRNGTWQSSGPDHDGGTFSIHGSTATFVWPRTAIVLSYRFTREARGTIRWTPVLPMDLGDRFVWASQPWRRIGPPTRLPG
jgi:hypothetical protein